MSLERFCAEFPSRLRELEEQHHDKPSLFFAEAYSLVPDDCHAEFLGTPAWQLVLETYSRLLDAHPAKRSSRSNMVHTQRWPRALHIALRREAKERGVSLNRLVLDICLSHLRSRRDATHDAERA